MEHKTRQVRKKGKSKQGEDWWYPVLFCFLPFYYMLTNYIKSVHNKVPPGILNQGTTCFLNSILQALAALPPFQTYLRQNTLNQHHTLLSTQLSHLLHLLTNQLPSSKPLDIRHFTKKIQSLFPEICFREQQDSHEVYLRMVGHLDNIPQVDHPLLLDLSDGSLTALPYDLPPIQLYGLSLSFYMCIDCLFIQNIDYQKHYLFSLNCQTNSQHSLGQALSHDYVREQQLANLRCIKCTLQSYLKHRTPSPPLLKLKSLIDHQSINLNNIYHQSDYHQVMRGQYAQDTLFHQNFSSLAPFLHKTDMTFCSSILHLGPLLCFHFDRAHPPKRNRTNSKLVLQSHLDTSSLPNHLDTSSLHSSYSLQAVIVHQGTLQNGHYFCYRRHHDTWLCCNDSSVRRVSLSEVLCCVPYMAFFQCDI